MKKDEIMNIKQFQQENNNELHDKEIIKAFSNIYITSDKEEVSIEDIMTRCVNWLHHYGYYKLPESKSLQEEKRYADIQKRLSKLAKEISDEATIDDDVTGGYMNEPAKSWVTELYNICDLMDSLPSLSKEKENDRVKELENDLQIARTQKYNIQKAHDILLGELIKAGLRKSPIITDYSRNA